MKNEQILFLRLVGILRCVKISEFQEYLKIHKIRILSVYVGVYRFAIIWMIPCLGLLLGLQCRLQDNGCGFQVVGGV